MQLSLRYETKPCLGLDTYLYQRAMLEGYRNLKNRLD